ncbi:unnamed protein product [Mytilus coruscus]|uniref:ALOG domain-containing protein n=1 Tax=Mytilus coruscus TaxID=42192 RepID=A0A6J8BRR8_MYTCO|nr:unnamed protein product [Mytilus coruscus]
MSLDSNVMRDTVDVPLRHFTPYPTPGSAGVNVFSQTLCLSDNLYVFPPFALILPVLSFLRDQKAFVYRNIRPIDYESCKICGCLNHKDFRFCQFCGDRREDSGEVSIDDQDLKSYNAKKRILYLENMLNNKTYKKKVSLKKDLESFLIGRAKNLTSATPEDIRLFLIDRDMKGKTKIHDLCCPFLGDKKFKDCSCPCRLASGTVSSLAIGKTLGNGKINEFVISPVSDKLICPVENLNQYVSGAEEMDIDLSVGYLFRTLDPSHSRVIESPVSSSGMGLRLQLYLKDLNIFEGETIHGIRGGCAITMMSSGIASSKEIMEHVGWFSKRSLDRYSRMNRLVDAGSVSSLFSKVADSNLSDARNIFHKLGDSSDLPQAFKK